MGCNTLAVGSGPYTRAYGHQRLGAAEAARRQIDPDLVVDGHKVFFGTADVRHQWIKNVQKNPRIRLSVGGEKFEAGARLLGRLPRPDAGT